MLKILSIVGLILYFSILLFAVTKEKKNTNVLDYFFGGRTLPFWALSITFIASWWGAGSAISTADLAYKEGMSAFFYYGVPVLISTFIMIIFSKAIRRVSHLTQGKMMEARYSKKVSTILSIMIFLFMTITASSQMVGIGDIFSSYLGLNYEFSVIIGTLIVLIYSMFGGFRGVVLTDIIQFVLLILSALIIFFTGMHFAGGFEGIMISANQASKPEYFNMFSNSSKYMSYVITFGCAWMIQANVWQRISATKNEFDAKKMTVMSLFAYVPLYLIVVLTGMSGIALYDTLPQGGIISALINDYMNPLLGAFVFVGLAAAIMSTLDSLINTGAMTLVVDLDFKDRTDAEKLKRSRYATLFVTIIAVVISLRIRSILEISWIASDIITTGVFVPLVLGFLWRRGNSKGAFSSMVVGSIFCFYNLFASLGLNLPVLWELQSAKQVIIGVALSTFFYVFISLLTKPEYEKADEFISLAGIIKLKK